MTLLRSASNLPTAVAHSGHRLLGWGAEVDHVGHDEPSATHRLRDMGRAGNRRSRPIG